MNNILQLMRIRPRRVRPKPWPFEGMQLAMAEAMRRNQIAEIREMTLTGGDYSAL
jgi:hypothetical protein